MENTNIKWDAKSIIFKGALKMLNMNHNLTLIQNVSRYTVCLDKKMTKNCEHTFLQTFLNLKYLCVCIHI